MKAPFPWFGGKRKIAAEVWRRFGDVPNYVEPFAGSAAVLLARPNSHGWADAIETINDKDGLVSNFWRAVQDDPDSVAHWADWPVNENDLHARHYWLVTHRDAVTSRLEGDPDWFDARVAGWWVWGICNWIGREWCVGGGPRRVVDGELVRDSPGRGINRHLPHLGDAGMGINRKLPDLGTAGGCAQWSDHLRHMMRDLADRLRRVRVCSGDWERVCGFSPTTRHGLTGVFLDPPYSHAKRDSDLYAVEMSRADDVRAWAVARGDNPSMRIALCGYEGEHDMPPTWSMFRWKAQGGYANQGDGRGLDNRHRETVWFSPHCLTPDTQASMFDALEDWG